MQMRRYKGLLCLLALLLLLAGYLFTGGPDNARFPIIPTFHAGSATSIFARPSNPPTIAENAPCLIDGVPTVESHPAFSSDCLAIYHLIGQADGHQLFLIGWHRGPDTNATLLAVIARTLGLSFLMLRE